MSEQATGTGLSRFTEFERALLTLANDSACSIAVRALEDAGVDVVVLKGYSTATWLYSGGVERPYSDTDLLVAPGQWQQTLQVLRGLGYRAPREKASAVERSTTELDLIGPADLRIDLHHRLAGSSSEPPDRCARELFRRTVRIPLGDTTVRVLDVPARAMHLALHAAQNGPHNPKSHEDLRRALVRLAWETWQEAADVARAIGAEVAFGVGLRTHPEGVVLAERLGLSEQTNLELMLRQQGGSAQALALVALSELRGVARLRLAWRKLVPTRALLTDRYALTGDRPLDMARAYGWHWRHVTRSAIPAVQAYRRARRDTPRPSTR